MINRRQFLIGAGGFSLALPTLSSLLVKKAYGAEPTLARTPRLFWLATNHGAAAEPSFFPDAALLTDQQDLFADHTVRAGALRATVEGTRRVISPILQADGALLSEHRLSQLNVLRGLDISFTIGHHTGGHLGNFACNEALAGPAAEARDHPRPTIDQLLAWSSTFYPDLSAVRERALVLGTRALSFGYSTPSRAAGTVQNVLGETSSLALFNRLFSAGARTPVVDRVLESYHRLRTGHRRLSSADRRRLDDHMDRIAELQRKLNTAHAACPSLVAPAQDNAALDTTLPIDAIRHAQLFNEVTAAAFMCGSTRIAVLGLPDELCFAQHAGDWHTQVAHEWQDPIKQALIATAYQRVFESVFLDLAARLDTEEADGASYLDNSLLVWSQESGMSTHDSVSIPVITAGSAAGAFNTGLSLDYRRNGDPASRFDPQANGYFLYAGLLYNQFLAHVLQAMGLAPAELELWGHKGYGVPLVDPAGYGIPPFASHYQSNTSRYFQIASDPLPFLQCQ
jgi:hypothetical protein